MNRAEKALMDRIGPTITKHGFRFNASNLTFKKRLPSGFLLLSFPSFTMGDSAGFQVIETGLGVRHDRVDDVVNMLGHIWGEENRKQTTTVFRGLEFFPFVADRDGRKTIRLTHVDHDVAGAGAELERMFLTDGLEFFEKYSSLAACSQGLNEPIESMTHPLFNHFPVRAYYGIACAALSEPDRIPALLSAYIDYVKRNEIAVDLVYDVGKDLSGSAAIIARLEAVAELAMARRAETVP